MTYTYAVIPFKDEPAMTNNILEILHSEPGVDEILLLDNGSRQESLDEITARWLGEELPYTVYDCGEMGIYEMWNFGWFLALELQGGEPVNVAFLNNDIEFIPGTIQEMARILRSDPAIGITYPNYNRYVGDGIGSDRSATRQTSGTYRHGGMSGWCWMIKGELALEGLQVDEDYEWWCGDDDIAFKVEAHGLLQVRLEGWPVDHLSEATAHNGENDWVHEAKGRDLAKFMKKHGR